MDRGEVQLREARINKLIAGYKATYKNVAKTIVDATAAGKIQKAQVMVQIRQTLKDYGVDVDKFIKEEIPQYYADGANHAIQDLRKMDVSVDRGFSVLDKQAIAALTDEVGAAFADSLTAVSRNANMVLTDAVKQQIQAILVDGKLQGSALKTISKSVQETLESEGLSALRDKSGRVWQFETYANMLIRTKSVEARNTGLQNRMLDSGNDLVQVSNHNSSDPACASWEGQILSVTGKTPGYPTLAEAEAAGLFHPNCQHAVNVIDPELAGFTKAYDNPYNYKEPEAEEDAPPRAASGTQEREFSFYRGSGRRVIPKDLAMTGKGMYVTPDLMVAETFGNVQKVDVKIKETEILKVNSQEEYNSLVVHALEAYPGDIQDSIPAYARSRGYKAIEVNPKFDELGGINLIDQSVIKTKIGELQAAEQDTDLTAYEHAVNAGNKKEAQAIADRHPNDAHYGVHKLLPD